MPITRSRGAVLKRRINHSEQGSAPKSKSPKSKSSKTKQSNAPNLEQANEEDAYSSVVVVQSENLRFKSSDAPSLGNHMLFLFVGEERKLITLHSDLLPLATKQYIEQQNQDKPIYSLPDDISILKTYRNFLYTNKIFSISSEQADMLNDETHADYEWSKLAGCYVFGVTVKDEKFANSCIDAIIEKIKTEDWYPTGMAPEIYEYTEEGDKLRKLIVDMHVEKGFGQWTEAPHDDALGPLEFKQDVIKGLGASLSGNGWSGAGEEPWVVDKCAYHSHELTARCE